MSLFVLPCRLVSRAFWDSRFIPLHIHQSMWEQEGHPKSIILWQWSGVLIACSKHHWRHLFPPSVSAYSWHSGFSLLLDWCSRRVLSLLLSCKLTLIFLSFGAGWMAGRSQALIPSSSHKKIHSLYEAATVGKLYMGVCLHIYFYGCMFAHTFFQLHVYT